MSISEWAGGQVFKMVHGHNLVYNTCWEDPRLDHQAMKPHGGRHRAGDYFRRLQCAGLRLGRA